MIKKIFHDMKHGEEKNSIDYESLERFLESGDEDELIRNSNFSPNMVSLLVITYLEYASVIWEHFEPPTMEEFMIMVPKKTEVEATPPKELPPEEPQHIDDEVVVCIDPPQLAKGKAQGKTIGELVAASRLVKDELKVNLLLS
jgi:hypothetical protein